MSIRELDDFCKLHNKRIMTVRTQGKGFSKVIGLVVPWGEYYVGKRVGG